MNRQQADRIGSAAMNFADATADARVWKQVYDTLPFVPELQQRYEEVEEWRKQLHKTLLTEINSAVTE